MKRLTLSFICLLLLTISMHASRALSIPVTICQPDGTQLTVILNGDKDFAWTTTTDGMLVMQHEKGGYYVAAIDTEGQIRPTALLAHEASVRTDSERQLFLQQQQYRSLFMERVQDIRQKARRAKVTSEGYFPHTGSPKCLVILVNFSDYQFSSTDPVAQFNQYFNGETQEDLGHNEQKNLVSVKKYFEQSSNGKFSPQFDIVGPVTLSQSYSYYGKNSSSSTDINFNQFCKDVIAAIDDQVNFSDYDNNHDGHAELACVIYAGYGESVSGNEASTIWPKCSRKDLSTSDNVTINYINCSPELYRVAKGSDINGIGLFCHEFSHGMGLPDLYPTNTAARVDNQTPEFWDLMDYGEYANNGYAPVPYTAWEREAMGWLEIEQLTQSQTGIEMETLEKGGKAYKFNNGSNTEEWMIIQNIQNRDNTNHLLGSAYGHGLLVMHVAYASSKVNMGDNPNNTVKKPRVSIVPADGLVINGYRFVNKSSDGQYHPTTDKPYTQEEYVASLKGDPFPGTGNVTGLNAEMETPNYAFYNGDATPVFKLSNIKEDGETGIVTFDFDDGTTTGIKTKQHDGRDDSYYTLDGRRLSGKPTHSGAYIHHRHLIILK